MRVSQLNCDATNSQASYYKCRQHTIKRGQPLRLINSQVILDETQHQATVALTTF